MCIDTLLHLHISQIPFSAFLQVGRGRLFSLIVTHFTLSIRTATLAASLCYIIASFSLLVSKQIQMKLLIFLSLACAVASAVKIFKKLG